jgi:hypothetical protein
VGKEGVTMAFILTSKARATYDRLFAESPQKANRWLYFKEEGDSQGRIKVPEDKLYPDPQDKLFAMMCDHFGDINAYQIPKEKSILEKRWR